MKYLLLDTNIYIDLVVNRSTQSHNTALLDVFAILVSSGMVKLVVPEIIKHELCKNVENSVDNAADTIICAGKAVKQLNFVTETELELDISRHISDANSALTALQSIHENNANTFKSKIRSRFDNMFASSNVLNITTSPELIIAVMQRKIFKKAPLHNTAKESYADALIIETLYQLKKLFSLTDDDMVYFVTNNYKDFALNKNTKHLFHQDIESDLRACGMYPNTKLINNFQKLINTDLKDEVSAVNLEDAFNNAYDYTAEDYEEHSRELAGLRPLHAFDAYLLDIANTEELTHVNDVLEEIFEQINIIEEYYTLHINSLDSASFVEWLRTHPQFAACILRVHSSLLESPILSSSLLYCQNLKFTNLHGDRISIIWENADILPRSGGADNVYIRLYCNKILASDATIKLNYGFVKLNDDCTIGDAEMDSTTIEASALIKYLQEILTQYKCFTNGYSSLLEN